MRKDAIATTGKQPLPKQESKVRLLHSVVETLTQQARETLQAQAAALTSLSERVDARFARAVRLLLDVEGHVIVTGLGKSGLVGRKIAATLASTGTPSFFVHSGEALHGDLGMITADDAVVLISYSGETPEVVSMLPYLRERGVPTIALVGKADSTLSRGVDIALDVAVEREVCPHNIVPTCSTLATLAMGDTIAVSLCRLRGFEARDFAALHPGGSLGRRLGRVGDAAVLEGLVLLTPSTPIKECLLELAADSLPMALVRDGERLIGAITSRRLREVLARPGCDLETPIGEILDPSLPVIDPEVSIEEADAKMEREGLEALVVVAPTGEVSGVYARPRTR